MHEVDLSSSETDEALAERARRGERDAESALVLRLYPGVLALALRLLRDVDLARDATQEAFLRAFSRIEQYDGEHRFSAWVFRILVNLIRDELRRPSRLVARSVTEEDWPAPAPPPAERVIREEDVLRARKAIDELPEETRLAVLLHFQEGLSGKEIGFALGLTHQAARLRICRGIAFVRARLSEDS
jgi:RNA polymerase sigma-70 factor (ECF subfamily)